MPTPINNSKPDEKSFSTIKRQDALTVARPGANAGSPKSLRGKPARKSKGARSGSTRSRNSSAHKAEPRPPIVRVAPSGPRVPIGDALCQAGFDEHAVAKEWIRIADALIRECENGGNQKLLVDVLKECSRQLESAQERHHSRDVVVHLVHTVSRPPRPTPALASANPPTLDVASQAPTDPPAVA